MSCWRRLLREQHSDTAGPGLFSRIFRLLPWLSLTCTVGVLLLILRQVPPLQIHADPQAADRVAEKMAQLQTAVQAGRAHTLALNEAELNQWMRDNLAIASAHQTQQAGIPVPAGHEASIRGSIGAQGCPHESFRKTSSAPMCSLCSMGRRFRCSSTGRSKHATGLSG